MFFVSLQEVVTVLQAHHAVQTLPEVGPEFTQAIVQTDISGPITASELTNAGLAHAKFAKPDADLQARVVVPHDDTDPGTVDHTSLEAVGVQTVDNTEIDSHSCLPASLTRGNLQVESDVKDEDTMKQTGQLHLSASHIGHSKTEFTSSQQTGRSGESNVTSTSVAYTSPPFQGECFPFNSHCVKCKSGLLNAQAFLSILSVRRSFNFQEEENVLNWKRMR